MSSATHKKRNPFEDCVCKLNCRKIGLKRIFLANIIQFYGCVEAEGFFGGEAYQDGFQSAYGVHGNGGIVDYAVDEFVDFCYVRSHISFEEEVERFFGVNSVCVAYDGVGNGVV